MTIYDTARQLKIPGVVVQAHIDPTQVSPRIKKLVQTMIRKGAFKGGWNSKSLMLARHLLDGKNLPMLCGWNTMFRCQTLTKADIEFFDELLEADCALEKMKMTDSQRESVWYVKRMDENVRENKVAVRRLGSDMMTFYARIDNAPIREQVHERLLALRMPEDVAALDAVAARLDDPTPIPVVLNIN